QLAYLMPWHILHLFGLDTKFFMGKGFRNQNYPPPEKKKQYLRYQRWLKVGFSPPTIMRYTTLAQ
ncbi:hypothetical protein, partial [Salmonella sp. s51884]|uniref:hypothetical protein n=1 Tax=Salmonella sp. s51884 TaxID=3159654 RepID=UPI0039803A6C